MYRYLRPACSIPIALKIPKKCLYIIHHQSMVYTQSSYLIPLCRTQFHCVESRIYHCSFFNWRPSYASTSLVCHLLMYLMQFLHSFHSTIQCEVTTTYSSACSTTRCPVHGRFQLLRGPTYPLLCHTLSISRTTVNIADIPGDIRLSLLLILWYPQLI